MAATNCHTKHRRRCRKRLSAAGDSSDWSCCLHGRRAWSAARRTSSRPTPRPPITTFSDPDRLRLPASIAAGGPDGNLWFTNTNRRIGRISVDDVIKTYNIARGRTPFDVATGADGNVWFTSLRSNRIGFVGPA